MLWAQATDLREVVLLDFAGIGAPMPRKLTKRQARAMSAARTNRSGGRPMKKTPCRKCGSICASETLSRVHCGRQKERSEEMANVGNNSS